MSPEVLPNNVSYGNNVKIPYPELVVLRDVKIGDDVYIGPFTKIEGGAEIGNGVKIAGNSNIYGCQIEEQTRIGTFVEIQRGASIGSKCKIQSHTFICDAVKIKDCVFVGHGVMFTNDLWPSAVNLQGDLKGDVEWRRLETIVDNYAVIGTGAVIGCNLSIGQYSFIGMGAVVTRSVPDKALVIGVPGRVKRYLTDKDIKSILDANYVE